MNEDIIPVGHIPEADADLVTLVDSFLEGRLSEVDKQHLELRLSEDEDARAYCADRLCFHSELQELMQPLRVEMEQRRHIVLERKHGLPHITTRESQVARIGNPKTGNFIEIPPDMLEVSTFRRRTIIAGCCLAALVCALVALLIWQEKNKPEVAPPTSVVLELRNAGFEDTDLTSEDDAFSYSLLDWQDHFLTKDAGVCDLARYSKHGNLAHTGKNVAILNARGYLTQRLKFSDGTPLIAQEGLHVRIRGWVLVEERNWRVPLRIALRIVKDVKPEMLQYEPCVESVEFSGGEWRKFDIDFVITEEDCKLSPSDVDNPHKKYPELDITGSPLTLTVENRSEGILCVDDLNIEIVSRKVE